MFNLAKEKDGKRFTRDSQRVRYKLGLLVWLPFLAVTGCNQSNSPAESPVQKTAPQSPKLQVVTTFLPIYWFTKAVVGDRAEVEILVPPGTEVHEYQAKPGNIQAIASANILVKNGLGLEAFLADTVKNAGNSKLLEIDTSKGIQPLEATSPTINPSESATDAEADRHLGNPHIWLDPVLVKQQVQNIRDGLMLADPANKVTYQANAAAYIQQLEELDQQFQARLLPYRGCTYITFHDAYPYLAQRYQLKQLAVVQIPEDSLSPADVQKTVAAVKKFKVKALLGESGVDNKLLQSLSQDLKLTLSSLDSMETGSLEPQSYFTAMKNNLQTLEAACK